MKTYNGDVPDWSMIPGYMMGGMRRYFEQGVKPGSFLCALFQNDFMEVMARADGNNSQVLHNYAVFLHRYAPGESFGSKANFDAWIKKSGLGWEEVFNG